MWETQYSRHSGKWLTFLPWVGWSSSRIENLKQLICSKHDFVHYCSRDDSSNSFPYAFQDRLIGERVTLLSEFDSIVLHQLRYQFAFSISLSLLAKEVYTWTEVNLVNPWNSFIPGKTKVLVDHSSHKGHVIGTEWLPLHRICNDIPYLWVTYEVDMFIINLSKK